MDVIHELNGNAFIWDLRKARQNLRKHGVRFEEAVEAFFDPLLVMVEASRNEEVRDAVIGFDRASRLLYVVHVEVGDQTLRLVSARRATAAEEAFYAHR